VSAAVAGVSQANMGAYTSRTYGGFFNTIFGGAVYAGRLLKSNTSTQAIPVGVTTVLFLSGSGGVTLTFPAINVEEGRILFFKNASGSNVYLNRGGSEQLVLNNLTTATSSTVANKTLCMWQ